MWIVVGGRLAMSKRSVILLLILFAAGVVQAGEVDGHRLESTNGDPVVLVLPQAGGWAYTGDSVRFIWRKAGPGVSRYWFQYALDSLWQFYIIDSTSLDTSKVLRMPSNPTTVFWRVRAKYPDGWSLYGEQRSLRIVYPNAVPSSGSPVQCSLRQNYPNPFNPSTTIGYHLPQRSHVILTVFSILGQEVSLLQNGEQEAGYHEVQFDAAGLSSGVYFYRMRAGAYIETKNLVLTK
jgi:hypothetical protein